MAASVTDMRERELMFLLPLCMPLGGAVAAVRPGRSIPDGSQGRTARSDFPNTSTLTETLNRQAVTVPGRAGLKSMQNQGIEPVGSFHGLRF
jgi:hypothetical protein